MVGTRLRLLVAFLAFAGPSLRAQASPHPDSAPALNEASLFADIVVLSADSMEGRLAGSPGSARARAFLIREFDLAIAEWTVAHPPLNSVIFTWFDGEEEGLVGSEAFVNRPPVPLDQIIADVNLDMVSRSPIGQLNIVGAVANPVMQPFIDTVAALGLVKVRQGHEGLTGDPIDSLDEVVMTMRRRR